ncbi:MAG: hypothetical protein F4X39_04615 [Acidobacteriia bacterium]|nr:hypothetical protein [Terriglobia bacterium]
MGPLMRLLIAALCLSLAGTAFAAEFSHQDVIERLRSEGGSVATDAEGQAIGVNLTSTWITDADLALVAKLPKLETIDLSLTKITDIGLEHLKKLENVRHLRMHHAEYLTDGGIAQIKGWKKLDSLDLRGTKVTSRVLEHIRTLTTLTALDLSHTEVTDSGFEKLAELTRLERLAIGGNRILGPGLDLLKMITTLRHLDVGGIQRVDSGLWGLALNEANMHRLAQLTQLESLNLSGANIADRGLDRPGHELARRKELHSLPRINPLVNLRELDLTRTAVDNADLAVVTQLPKLRRLRVGYASNIDDGAASIFLRLPQLENLYLTETNVGDATLDALQQSKSLRKLAVGGTKVSAERVARFRAARPDCELVWWAPAGETSSKD